MRHIICVGACYIDTILTVPHFPSEDDKLRATKLSRRRGGNCPNSLEVLSQLIEVSKSHAESCQRSDLQNIQEPVSLSLVAVLPNAQSSATKLVRSSLPSVSLDHCIYRVDCEEAASSYITRSEENGSRTIVNYNELAEMTIKEFMEVVNEFARNDTSGCGGDNEWWHFEGRIPDTTLQCMQYVAQQRSRATISVEVEKPNREGLEDMAKVANVVFYSKSWACAKGYNNPSTFLEKLNEHSRELQFCTWGADGAAALVLSRDEEENEHLVKSLWPLPATHKAVDTIGAGDTFIAGILFAYAATPVDLKSERYLARSLSFTTELAGRKVMQDGFQGLGEIMNEQIIAILSPLP